MADLRSWVEESNRKGERLQVIIRNLDTKEEVVTGINPDFAAGVSTHGEITKVS